ncbi:MAG: glycoside hydrolase family 55 protein, partial [Prevotellaceae bacterium]|nr:glycoside hydrolase family 55 protein [Prevotellaceae bacterium]
MILKRRIILTALTAISFTSWAQIPSSYQTDFSHAGYNGAIPSPSNIVTPGNLDKVGAKDMTSIVHTAVNNVNAQGGGVVFLPEGTYLFNGSISLKSNVVLRGAGSDKTTLRFDLTGATDPILMKGSMATTNNAAQPLSSDATRGSNTISLKSNPLPNTTAGKMVLLYQKPGLKA